MNPLDSQLHVNPKLLVARRIAALLKHELGCEGPKADEVAMNLADYLDRQPEAMFGMTFDQLYACVIDWKARQPAPLTISPSRTP